MAIFYRTFSFCYFVLPPSFIYASNQLLSTRQGKKRNKTLLLCNIHHHHHPHQDVFSSVFRSTPSLFSPSPPRPSSSSSPLQSITRQKISNLCLETTRFLSDPRKLSHRLACDLYALVITNVFVNVFIRSKSDHWLCLSLTHSLPNSLTDSCLVNLIDVTLACEDGNSKLVVTVWLCLSLTD